MAMVELAEQWVIKLFLPGASDHECRVVVASETNRSQWEGELLACLPAEPLALAAMARARISIVLERPPIPTKHVRSQYGAYSAAKMSRMAERLVSEPTTATSVRKYAEQYLRDAEADAAAVSARDALIQSRLPAAPPGYLWFLDSGGIRWGGSPACFRLWSHSLGYMPTSE
jgi:hypothetical protein